MGTSQGDGSGRGTMERVVVLGTGLIGTSIALALREHGIEVALSDPDQASLSLACDLGAGHALEADAAGPPADLAVIAAPPAAIPAALHQAQGRGLAHAYTDVASVKGSVLAQAERLGCDMSTFVPGHPMGGREKHGPSAARADLFLGRSWALCPTDKADSATIAAVTELALACRANPLVLDADDHDRAVALVSHAPHVAASAVAARLLGADPAALALAGQGVRDVTRIAAGDPRMWLEILSHNAAPVSAVLDEVAQDLAATAQALRRASTAPVADLLRRGRSGHATIPGKHGVAQTPEYALVPVVIPDEPGALGKLFATAGEAGVNIEDVRIDHSPGLPLGVAQLHVLPGAVQDLARALSEHGWSVHPQAGTGTTR